MLFDKDSRPKKRKLQAAKQLAEKASNRRSVRDWIKRGDFEAIIHKPETAASSRRWGYSKHDNVSFLANAYLCDVTDKDFGSWLESKGMRARSLPEMHPEKIMAAIRLNTDRLTKIFRSLSKREKAIDIISNGTYPLLGSSAWLSNYYIATGYAGGFADVSFYISREAQLNMLLEIKRLIIDCRA